MYVCNDGNGFVKLHRSLNGSRIIKDRDLFQLWGQMLLWAFWYDGADGKFHGKQIKLKRGQFIASQREMAESLGMQRSLLSRKLAVLKTEQRIDIRSDRQTSLITICNWEKYQDTDGKVEQRNEQRNEQRSNNDRTTIEPRSGCSYIEEEGKKERSIPPPPPTGGDVIPKPKKWKFDPEDIEIAKQWAEYAKEVSTTVKVNLEKWANEFRLIRTIDKVPIEEIRRMLIFVRNDPFWRPNAVSPMGLRVRGNNDEMKHTNIRNAMARSKPHEKPVAAIPKTSNHLLSGKFANNGH